MPEKPKRKNKNKNKRKNKNNRADNNKNNCDVTEKESEGSCSAQIALKEAIPISEKDFNGLVPENTLAENGISENDIDSEIQRCDTSTNAVCVSEDVNNNSSAIAANTLHVPIEHLNDVDDNKNIEEHETDAYLVESPEQSLKSKPKLNNTNKSKSLDNDDAPKIVDITEDNVLQSEEESSTAFVDTSNILVSDAESDIEWEKTEDVEIRRIDDMAAESMSISTAPLNVALCQQVNISLSPDIEASLRSYLHTLDLSTHPENSIEIKAEIEQIINREIRHRLRKKGFADDLGLQRLAPPRKLDVINEEGSSESSQSSRRQSYLSDKKSDNEDLEDDVFEDKNKFQQKNAKWAETTSHKRAYGRLVPQQCMLVGAKIKEPEVTEARGDWSMQTVEKMTGAEIVYLTDSSSSTSSLHDYGDETDDGMETDVSVRMITPTIEVTDTENLLKNSFIASSPDKLRDKKVNPTKEHIIHNKDYNQDNIEIAKKDKIRDNSTQNSNEILVLSTDNIVTNLYVKDVEPTLPNIDVNEKLSSKITNLSNDENVVNIGDKYDLEIKVLKCELNDAINNLIKEVSDSEQHETSKDTFARQDSSSSVSSSQCTAKYNPTSSSLNDISNILHDETEEDKNLNAKNNESKTTSSHVKDVFEHVAGATNVDMTQLDVTAVAPSHLRDLCVRRIASFPYGDKILEELASVSKRIQKITGAFITENTDSNITNFSKIDFSKKNKIRFYDAPPIENIVLNSSKSLNQESVPPPTQPRHSSLKKKSRDEEVRFGVPAKTEPVYVCLSPSQKMLMEKTQTIIAKEDVNELPNMNQKFVDQRNYNENYSREQHTDQKADDISPIVSFKSQTGSRLLALIRDPTVTKSVNIPNERLDQLEQKSTVPQTNSKKHENIFDVPHTFNTFRPIPPPRPKKLASSFYESDESSDFTDSSMRSMKSERKVFHFSTGNLNKEIEDDISSIQNMHRYYMNTRETINESPRRPSLPKDLCDQQMEYIRQKEKEVEAEIQRLESLKNNTPSAPPKLGPRAPLLSETEENDRVFKDSNNYFISKRRDFFASLSAPEKQEKPFPNSDYKKEKGNLSKVFSSSQEELLREKMYSEYVTQMAQREERKQHKVIKITNTPVATSSKTSKSMPTINRLDSKVNNRIEKEFISKARERWDKLGIVDPETEDETDTSNNVYKEPKVIEHKIKVIEGGQEKDVTNLPSHLQEFVRFTSKEKEQRNDSSETVMITPTFKARSTSPAVWRPGGPPPPGAPAAPASSPGAPPLPPPPPVWTPGSSPLAGRKTYRPVHFEDTPPTRRKFGNPDQNGCASGSESEGRGLTTSRSAPVTGFNTLSSNTTSRLPRAQNPTVTLLQKAREGQIPRGSSYIQEEARLPRDRPSPPRGDPVYALRREYASETEGERSEHERGSRKMADAQKKIDGIGPITREGMPVSLRSEVKDPSKWYKKMYDTIHKNKYDDDYVTIRYKSRRGQPPERVTSNKSQYAYFDPRSGYLSEPEGGLSRLAGSTWSDAYDSDVTSGPRRRTASVQEDRRMNETITYHMPNNKYSTLASGRASQEVYKGQPGRIENYMPGRSSVVDKEAKQWWDEVMDIFDGQNISSTTSLPQASPKEKKDITSAILSKSNMARALKESGYESDSTLVFRRREETDGPLSPAERRAAYRDLQAGGEPPLRGFRSPAPHRQDESEIEYIPISPTLTKIRVHKKTPQYHEVICYPVTRIETDSVKFRKQAPSFYNPDPNRLEEYPPAPPRRISSRNSRTLRLVTSTRPVSTSPKRTSASKVSQTNVDFLKDKISHKLQRQNTHIISKSPTMDIKKTKSRIMSMSAPPAVNRKNTTSIIPKMTPKVIRSDKPITTNSFGSSRRTPPTEYSNLPHSRYSESQSSVVIEGGAGRRTPISNILEKVTPLDKLWSAEKRNEQINLTKTRSLSKSTHNIPNKVIALKQSISPTKLLTPSATHRSRDMVRTAEKVQKLKVSNSYTKSSPCLVTKNDQKVLKPNCLQSSSYISKSSTSIASPVVKKQNHIKTATVTNLKKKKSLESVIIRPRSVPCHETCSKKSKENNKLVKKAVKSKSSKTPASTKSSNDSEHGSQFGDTSNDVSNFGSIDNLVSKRVSAKEIKQSHDAVVSDSFFQHLFLGKSYAPSVVTYPVFEENTTVLQKAKMFQSIPKDTNMPKSLNSYLIHRKPVSLSRFKMWDRHESPSSYQGPRSVSWPGRMHNEIRKFDSLSKSDEFGSSSSLATIRSRSEPPDNKFFFSQTTRPKAPVVIFHKRDHSIESLERSSVSPSRLYFTQTSRPVSPKVISKIEKTTISGKNKSMSPQKITSTDTIRSVSPTVTKVKWPKEIQKTKEEPENCPSTLFFSQTSRPVSPKVTKKMRSPSRSQSTSPVSIRSPSYRRIHNVRMQSSKNDNSYRSVLRTRSAGDAEKKGVLNNIVVKTQSASNLHSDDPEYDEYVRDMQNNRARSERFRELNRYYAYLERVGELEKATSMSDLRHRRKDEEIIDFERWKKIRSIERAEEELNNLYHKLKVAQTENDVLFYPRDVKDFRWNYDTDRGLRIKEKSVEDLKDHFQQISHYDSLEYDPPISKDTYKPLWRGTSVAETAFYINRKSDSDPSDRPIVKPTVALQQEATLSELRKKIGLGSRLWSSLSMDQVNALKNQLNAIYSKELDSKSNKDCDKYSIDVSDSLSMERPNLQVRCNSLTTSDYTNEKDNFIKLSKSDSIAAIPCPVASVKDLKNNVNKIQMTLTENEKRKISQTLSKELLDRINKFDNSVPMSLKQEMEISPQRECLSVQSIDNDCAKINSPLNSDKINKSHKIDVISDVAHKLPSYSNEKSEAQFQSTGSETETASSDQSNKTVIYRGPSKEVQKKVKYFESVKKLTDKGKIFYHARESSDDKDKQEKSESLLSHSVPTILNEPELPKHPIVQSQSCTNFKELFGESEINKFLSLPSKPEQRSRSGSPHSEVYIADRRTPDTLLSSEETIWRSRSPSPDPERYWRAYLNLARAGEVRRLARRFDSPTAAGAVLRRHRSDPEIARNVLTRNWAAFEKLSRRDRGRGLLPVARVPLRPTNRYMPHIDIISKLAAFRRRTAPRSRSAEEAQECRQGEVGRIRRRFETMSLLGQIYASAPDVSELHDMAPYLAGSWVAHRFPRRSDNNRSIKDPLSLVRGRTSPIKRELKRETPKESIKLSSILKGETLEKQEFDPSLHQVVKRYEPPRTPPRPPPASWPFRQGQVTPSRHTVTFKESDSAPEPPRRTSHGSYSDTESPRRYVESDVNIHYRCPVRHDPLPLVPEKELARQQAEHMKRLYREQRRNKYLQELQDMQNRRHQDNFTPSQKNILPLNRYDEAERVIAKALYTFNGQTPRELSFRKGDVIHVRRQIDSNWYEGEIHGRIGLFPYNYVEIQKGDTIQAPKKAAIVEGRARAKFDFNAQTNLELPLKKGEVVVLTRRIDQNWWEGRNGTKTGIFPDSYVSILQEPSQNKPEPQPMSRSDKPVASPAAHGLMNGSAKRSMGAHSYLPQQNSQALSNAPPATQPLPGYTTRQAQSNQTPSERGYGPPTGAGVDLNNSEPLYVDTNAEAIPYRAMYKYRPQNPDELELSEGDTVYVLEKCDDGWYVGSSQRTGRFGTFPGNYVERI